MKQVNFLEKSSIIGNLVTNKITEDIYDLSSDLPKIKIVFTDKTSLTCVGVPFVIIDTV